MNEEFKIFNSSQKGSFDYSILIPTWNNLAILQLCIESINKHSHHNLQILVFVNEGIDRTTDWLEENNISYIQSKENIGICKAMNALRSLVQSEVICYLNDDMYVLPDWDKYIFEKINSLSSYKYFISSTMIEPRITGNKVVLFGNFGDGLDNFKEKELLESFDKYENSDWSGSSWPPLFLSSKLWDEIDGFSEEFSPGMYSDPDMAMKAWQKGNRLYLGVGKSKVYHFGSKSTQRIRKNKGRQTFILKWGISSRFFYKHFLKMGSTFDGPLPEVKINLLDRIINKAKAIRVKNQRTI